MVLVVAGQAFTPSEDATPEAQHAHFVKQHERVSAVANQWNKLHPYVCVVWHAARGAA